MRKGILLILLVFTFFQDVDAQADSTDVRFYMDDGRDYGLKNCVSMNTLFPVTGKFTLGYDRLLGRSFFLSFSYSILQDYTPILIFSDETEFDLSGGMISVGGGLVYSDISPEGFGFTFQYAGSVNTGDKKLSMFTISYWYRAGFARRFFVTPSLEIGGCFLKTREYGELPRMDMGPCFGFDVTVGIMF